MADNKLVKRLRNIVMTTIAVLLAIATGAAFILSYAHIAKWALSHGFNELLAWCFPAFVDIVTITAELSLLLLFLIGASARQRIIPWIVVILFFGVSVAMQVGTSPGIVTTQATLALPPLAVAVLVFLAMVIVEALIKQNKLPMVKKSEPVKEEKPKAEKKTAPKKISATEKIFKILDKEGVDKYAGTEGDSQLAKRIGVSTRTAYRAKKKYEEEKKNATKD